MSTHLNDIVTLKASGLKDVKEVNMLVSCELMKNQLKASPVDPSDTILVAQDSLGHAIIFAIGSDHKFRLLKYTNGSNDGFTQIELSSGFKGYDKAVTFDLSEDSQGNINIAVALSKTGSTSTDIFVASQLSNDFSKTNWESFNTLCKKVSGIDANFIADHIRLGVSADQKKPLIVSTGKINNNEFYYEINEKNEAVKLELPENVHKPTEIELGYCFGQKGKFFLYQIGDTQTLECTTIADQFEGSETYDFSPGNSELPQKYRNMTYNCMAVSSGIETNPMTISSDLYIGTNTGVYLFKGGKISKGFQVVSDTIEDVHQVIVAEDEESISVWATASPNRLYYIYGKKEKDGSYTFNDAILFNQNTLHIAPIRNRVKNTNELYLIDQKENVVHFWQDGKTTIWNQRTINVKGGEYLIDFTSFTTNIKLTDQNGTILPNTEVEILSSEWIFANINGQIYSLDVDVPATVKSDNHGNINIIQMTEDISSPILHLNASFLSKTINIYQNGKIEKGLTAIENGNDLKNAKDQDGKPVLSKSLSDDTVNGVAYNLDQLTNAASTHKVGTQEANHVFVTLTDVNVKETGKLNVSHLPSNFSMGMKLSNGVWQHHNPNDGGFISTGGILDDIKTFAGDALHWLEHAFVDGIKLIEKGVTFLKDGVSFVIKKVGEVLHFVLTIADKVLTIVLDTMLTVFKAINWVLKLVGIDLTAILRWLGHLLGLDTVWNAHKVIAALLNNGIDYGAEVLENKLQEIHDFLETNLNKAEDLILSQVLPSNVKSQSLSQAHNLDNPMNSSAGSWVFSQIMHHNLLGGGTGQKLKTNNPFIQFYQDVIEPTVSVTITDIAQVIEDFSSVLSGNVEDAYKLIPDLIKLIIDPIKTIILGVIEFLKDFVGDIQAFLTEELNIPFLSTLYKYFTALMGEEEKLTITNGVALIIAIPYCFVHKVITGETAFSEGDYGMKSPDYFKSLFGHQKKGDFVLTGATSPAEYYSKIGGGIAAIAAIPASIISLISFASEENDSEMGVLDKIGLAFSVVTDALTFPIKKNTDATAGYVLKLITWGLTVIKDIGFKRIPSGVVAAGSEAVVDAVNFCLALPANILNKEDGWSYSQDILSNGGGCAASGGIAAKGTEVGEIVGVIGAGIAYFGAIIGLVNVVKSDDVKYLINPAG
ncbi:hypothetical protein ACOSP6_01845 [Tenacibaculum sp. MEBiC06402]|uniref:hypothetical protein n=1 Tax=unclassified Tenacibaculum TaxID=2635139 RepID=UPI003B9CF971